MHFQTLGPLDIAALELNLLLLLEADLSHIRRPGVQLTPTQTAPFSFSKESRAQTGHPLCFSFRQLKVDVVVVSTLSR